MAGWLEGLRAPDLGFEFREGANGGGALVAGKHYAATQTMDEERRQNINYNGAFGHDGAAVKSVRKADEATISFSALLVKGAGTDSILADEDRLVAAQGFAVACRRGPSNWRVYDECEWTRVAVNSTLEQVTINADIAYPQQA